MESIYKEVVFRLWKDCDSSTKSLLADCILKVNVNHNCFEIWTESEVFVKSIVQRDEYIKNKVTKFFGESWSSCAILDRSTNSDNIFLGKGEEGYLVAFSYESRKGRKKAFSY